MTSRTMAFVGAAALALVLSGCESTAQLDDAVEPSVPGGSSGSGGSGGGIGAGTGAGGAASGAGSGIPTLPGALPPTAAGSPSMPQDGSKPNPAPSTTSRSATGMPGTDAGTAPEGGPPIPGTNQDGSERGGETAGERAPDGVPNANGVPTGNAHASAPGEPGQTGDEVGASDSEADDSEADGSDSDADGRAGEVAGSGGEAGDSGNEIGASGGDADESGGASGQNGSGEELGANGAEAGQNVPGIAGESMTGAERRAAIRGRLDASYAAIDRLTLEERERVRRAASTGSAAMGRGGSDANGLETGGGGDGTGARSAVVASNNTGTGGAVMPNGRNTRLGNFDAENAATTYPVPADIPSGDDDDVVARQLREVAMYEADPDLRERLWDEYREYVGLKR